MVSGANQALLLNSLASGVSLVVLALLCIAVSLRHLLYGLTLARRLAARRPARAGFAYGLTDEVFATALAAEVRQPEGLYGPWLVGLAMTALLAWVVGTGLGNAVGAGLEAQAPRLSDTLDFALPALFLALLLSSARRPILGAMGIAAGLAAVLVALGRPDLAVPASALAAFLPLRGRR